jgi:hypothetical protein
LASPFPSTKQNKYQPLTSLQFFSGLWTVRSPLRDGATPFVYQSYNIRRYDTLIDGENTEITSKLTLARRPGLSVYNSQTFPAIDAFYSFHTFAETNAIRVIADTAAQVYDATGPNTKLLLLNKTSGAGQTYFQSVGNTLFFGNGVDRKKWVRSSRSWAAATAFKKGEFVVDSNNNLQLVTQAGTTAGSQPSWSTTLNVEITDGTVKWKCKGSSVQNWGIVAPGSAPSVANTTAPSPYPTWQPNTVYSPSLSIIDGNNNIQLLTTAGTTGGSQPSWNVTVGGTTADSTAVWTNKGTANWQASHAYSSGDVVAITITTTVTEEVCFSGTTRIKTPQGVSEFNDLTPVCTILTKYGERTADLIVKYFDGEMLDMGGGQLVTKSHRIERNGAWVPAEDAFPDAKAVNYRGLVYNLSVRSENTDEHHYILANGEVAHNAWAPYEGGSCGTETYTITTNCFFQCTTAGTSSGSQPAWVSGTGLTVNDGSVIWTNKGNQQHWSDIGANTSVSNASIVVANGIKQAIAVPGKSGAAPGPTWKTNVGETTLDNTAWWTCQGPFSAAGTASWYYAYAFKNSLTGHVSTASPLSNPITVAASSMISVQGTGSDDPQVDTVQIYRTAQGGSTLLYLTEVANPGASGQWSYSDLTADTYLNQLIEAEISNSNDPPPIGAIIPSYHQGRVWVAVNNYVYASAGPDTTNGSGNESFPPANVFAFPSQVVRLQPYTQGLLVFTVSDTYIILGQGAITNFYSVPFLKGYGLLSYNALDTNGSIFYMMTSDNQCLTLDPGSGVSDVGARIGNILSAWNPANVYVTWHTAGSLDKAAYLSDGSTGWYRLNPTPSPETDISWSPKARITGGCRAVQSLEVTPGHHHLLVSSAGSGPILYRDTGVYTDNGTPYSAYATIGSVLLAPHGQTAAVSFIGVDCPKVGSAPMIGVLLDEISGQFDNLRDFTQDPTDLPPSNTLWGLRYYLSQTGKAAICRHLQIKVSWPAEDAANELLDYTLYGCILKEG